MKQLVTAAYLLTAASAYGAWAPTPIVIAGATPSTQTTPVPMNTPVPQNTPVPKNTPVPQNTPVTASTPLPGALSSTAGADLLRAQRRDRKKARALRRRAPAAAPQKTVEPQ